MIKNRRKNIRGICAVLISFLSLLGIIVCSICNVAITGGFTWSLYPITAILFAWVLAMPVILLERKGIVASLILLSVLMIPFLFVLGQIMGDSGLLMPIGSRVSGVAIIYLWAIYLLFRKVKGKFTAAAISVLLAIPVSWGINTIIDTFAGQPAIDVWDIIACSILLLIAATLFGCGYVKKKKIIKDNATAI